jgi:SPX domain protein involved in polyphosphate accumulation
LRKGAKTMAIAVQTDFCRIENKYFIDADKVPAFLATLKEHLDLDPYAKALGYYQVNTIYFDNGRDDVVYRSLSSPTYKCKLRLRSYGGEKPIYFLEFKKKFKSDVYKSRIFLSKTQYEDFVQKGRLPDLNGEFKHDQFLMELADMVRRYGTLKPREVIQYKRQAFMNKEGEETLRLTIDSDILVRRDNFEMNHLGGSPLLPKGKLLIEVKLERALPVWLANALTTAGAFRGAYSKYGSSYGEYVAGDRSKDDASPLIVPSAYPETSPALASYRS